MQIGPKDIEVTQPMDTSLRKRELEDRAWKMMVHFLELADNAGDNEWHPLNVDAFIKRFKATYGPEWLAQHLEEVFVKGGYLTGSSTEGYLPTLKFLGIFKLRIPA